MRPIHDVLAESFETRPVADIEQFVVLHAHILAHGVVIGGPPEEEGRRSSRDVERGGGYRPTLGP